MYVCRWGWWAAFVSATFVMLFAVARGAFTLLLNSPGAVRYCLSLTRNTPYVQNPQSKSTLSGMKRAKKRAVAFTSLKVNLVNVEGKQEVG